MKRLEKIEKNRRCEEREYKQERTIKASCFSAGRHKKGLQQLSAA
jgi:hypothetical protein